MMRRQRACAPVPRIADADFGSDFQISEVRSFVIHTTGQLYITARTSHGDTAGPEAARYLSAWPRRSLTREQAERCLPRCVRGNQTSNSCNSAGAGPSVKCRSKVASPPVKAVKSRRRRGPPVNPVKSRRPRGPPVKTVKSRQNTDRARAHTTPPCRPGTAVT